LQFSTLVKFSFVMASAIDPAMARRLHCRGRA